MPFPELPFAFFDSFKGSKGHNKCEQRASPLLPSKRPLLPQNHFLPAKGKPFASLETPFAPLEPSFARTTYALCFSKLIFCLQR